MVDFLSVKKSHAKKKKMMLWIDLADLDRIEEVKPPEITNQEAIRQIIKNFLEEGEEEFAGL